MAIFGDFTVADAALDFASEQNSERSEAAREADRAKRAPVTTDANAWASDKSGLDFPGVDTPTDEPSVLPKDLMQSNQPDRTAQSRGDTPPGFEGVSPASNTDAPDAELSRLASEDVSLAPEEAFEGVGSGTQEPGPTSTGGLRGVLAGNEEADTAFDSAERERLFDL